MYNSKGDLDPVPGCNGGITLCPLCHWATVNHGALAASDNAVPIPETTPTVQSSYFVQSTYPEAFPGLQGARQTQLIFESLNKTANCGNSDLDRNTLDRNWAPAEISPAEFENRNLEGKMPPPHDRRYPIIGDYDFEFSCQKDLQEKYLGLFSPGKV